MPTGNLGNLTVGLILNTEKFSKGSQKARTELVSLSGAAKFASRAFSGLGLAFGTSQIFRGLQQAAQELDNMTKAAAKLGTSTEAIYGLSRAAELAGATSQTLTRAMTFMERNISSANKAFGDLNLNVKELQQLNPEFQFLAIADALKKVGDQGNKVKLTRDIFGRAGDELLPLMKGGAAEIRREMAISQTPGASVASGVVDLNDEAKRTANAFKTLQQSLFKFAPLGTKLMEHTTRFLGGATFSGTTALTEVFDKMPDTRFAKMRTQFATNPRILDALLQKTGGTRHDVEAAFRERELRMLQEHQEKVAKLSPGPSGPKGMAGAFPMPGMAMFGMNAAMQYGFDRIKELAPALTEAQLHRLNSRFDEQMLGPGPSIDNERRRSMATPRSLSALQYGTAEAFSQERRSAQQSQILDLERKQLKAQEQQNVHLRSIDTNLKNATLATEAANFA